MAAAAILDLVKRYFYRTGATWGVVSKSYSYSNVAVHFRPHEVWYWDPQKCGAIHQPHKVWLWRFTFFRCVLVFSHGNFPLKYDVDWVTGSKVIAIFKKSRPSSKIPIRGNSTFRGYGDPKIEVSAKKVQKKNFLTPRLSIWAITVEDWTLCLSCASDEGNTK